MHLNVSFCGNQHLPPKLLNYLFVEEKHSLSLLQVDKRQVLRRKTDNYEPPSPTGGKSRDQVGKGKNAPPVSVVKSSPGNDM